MGLTPPFMAAPKDPNSIYGHSGALYLRMRATGAGSASSSSSSSGMLFWGNVHWEACVEKKSFHPFKLLSERKKNKCKLFYCSNHRKRLLDTHLLI